MMPTALASADTTVQSVNLEPLAALPATDLPDLSSLPSVPNTLRASSSRTPSTRPPPRCIHELEEPSFAIDFGPDASTDASFCHCASMGAAEEDGDDLPPTPKPPLPFRSTGWIDSADENSELRSYYERRTPPSGPSPAGRRAKSYSGVSATTPSRTHHSSALGSSGSASRRIITPHNAPTEYTLALLNERARLLDELAKIKGSPSTASG